MYYSQKNIPVGSWEIFSGQFVSGGMDLFLEVDLCMFVSFTVVLGNLEMLKIKRVLSDASEHGHWREGTGTSSVTLVI